MADADNRQHDLRPPLVAVFGPTAVGKTRLGVDLALAFAGEVVNADSRYLYRGFDIGVAKPTPAERRGVPHHLVDVLPPDGEMTLARFQELAFAAIADVTARGRLPVLVGGTPLYMNAVVEGWRIPRVPPDPALRDRLEREIAERGLPPVAERLRAVDPTTHARSGTNARRVVRALEVWEATGRPMSELEGRDPIPYRVLEIGLEMPRATLRAAVDARLDDQIAAGLVEEVRALLAAGVPPDAPAMSSLGYRQLLPLLAGTGTLADAVRQTAHDTHRYLRHQETWLRRNPRLRRFDVTEPGWRERVLAETGAFLG